VSDEGLNLKLIMADRQRKEAERQVKEAKRRLAVADRKFKSYGHPGLQS
jgi:hypothetical protein